MSTQNAHSLNGVGSEVAKSEDSLCLDTIFGLLKNSRRRAVIQIVMEHERIDFGELVDRVAELEYGLPIEEISGDERHTIYVSLQQTHSGRLEEAGVIERERDTGAISLGHNADELAGILSKIDGDDSLTSKLKRAISV